MIGNPEAVWHGKRQTIINRELLSSLGNLMEE
jgi:hypothetical protein